MANQILFGISLFVSLIQIGCNALSIDPLVSLSSGLLIRGSKLQSTKERDFFAFRGIPYGQSPVGALRFQASHVHIFY